MQIYLQKSVPIQPKTSNILPKFCRSADWSTERNEDDRDANRHHRCPARGGPPGGLRRGRGHGRRALHLPRRTAAEVGTRSGKKPGGKNTKKHGCRIARILPDRSRAYTAKQVHSNYILTKIGFHTADDEPSKTDFPTTGVHVLIPPISEQTYYSKGPYFRAAARCTRFTAQSKKLAG